MERPLILVTNDDGINSPGLAAAVAALDPLGDLLIAAPAIQQTSMGRSRGRLGNQGGQIVPQQVCFGDKTWDGFAIRHPSQLGLHITHRLIRVTTICRSGIQPAIIPDDPVLFRRLACKK